MLLKFIETTLLKRIVWNYAFQKHRMHSYINKGVMATILLKSKVPTHLKSILSILFKSIVTILLFFQCRRTCRYFDISSILPYSCLKDWPNVINKYRCIVTKLSIFGYIDISAISRGVSHCGYRPSHAARSVAACGSCTGSESKPRCRSFWKSGDGLQSSVSRW